MNKKTKIELVVFALVALFYLVNLASCGKKEPVSPQSAVTTTTEAVSAVAQAAAPASLQNPTTADGGASEPVSASQAAAAEAASGAGSSEASKADSGQSIQADAASETQANAPSNASVPENTAIPAPAQTEVKDAQPTAAVDAIAEDGSYTDKDSVALYIATYGHLPSNYITKSKARDAGWDSSQGNLDRVCPGMSIGGDRFGNYEGNLPDKKSRKYFECDINYNPKKGYRGAERIIYSNDGLVYYTGDHYNTFELLYGEP